MHLADNDLLLNISSRIGQGKISVTLDGVRVLNPRSWGTIFNNALTYAVTNSQDVIQIIVHNKVSLSNRRNSCTETYAPQLASEAPTVSVNVQVDIHGSTILIPSSHIHTFQVRSNFTSRGPLTDPYRLGFY